MYLLINGKYLLKSQRVSVFQAFKFYSENSIEISALRLTLPIFFLCLSANNTFIQGLEDIKTSSQSSEIKTISFSELPKPSFCFRNVL